MKVLRDLLDQAEPLFHKGGRLEKFTLYTRQPIHFYIRPVTSPTGQRTCATALTSSAP